MTGDSNREKMEWEGLLFKPLPYNIHCRIKVFPDDGKITDLRASYLFYDRFFKLIFELASALNPISQSLDGGL